VFPTGAAGSIFTSAAKAGGGETRGRRKSAHGDGAQEQVFHRSLEQGGGRCAGTLMARPRKRLGARRFAIRPQAACEAERECPRTTRAPRTGPASETPRQRRLCLLNHGKTRKSAEKRRRSSALFRVFRGPNRKAPAARGLSRRSRSWGSCGSRTTLDRRSWQEPEEARAKPPHPPAFHDAPCRPAMKTSTPSSTRLQAEFEVPFVVGRRHATGLVGPRRS